MVRISPEHRAKPSSGVIQTPLTIGVGADKILVKDGVMFLSNKVNRNFAASSACIADSFRHDVCVFVLSTETHLTLVKLHFCSVWPKYW